MKSIRGGLGAILFYGTISIGGCIQPIDTILMDKNLDGKSVRVYDVKHYPLDLLPIAARHGTRVEILDVYGVTTKVLYDVSSGYFGDQDGDYVKLRLHDGRTKKFTRQNYTNEQGQDTSYESPLGREIKKIAIQEFREGNILIEKIKKELAGGI